MKLLPISVNVSTFNEEENIGYCLECIAKNNPAEVIVIDAGSTDKTCEIAKSKGAKVIKVEKLGLAYQRSQGLLHSQQPYIAMVDAQDKLEPDCLGVLISELQENGYHAIQAQTFARRLNTYWEKAYEFTTTLSINTPGPTNMVGRPCIYESKAINSIGFDPFFSFGVGCEDVDVSIQFEEKGYYQGMGSGRVHRDHPRDFATWWRKWVKYGRGDARIIYKYPHKRKAIRRHQLIGYPVERAWRAVKKGGALYVPFFLLFGFVRFFSSLGEPKRMSQYFREKQRKNEK